MIIGWEIILATSVGYKNSSYIENTVGENFINYLIKGYGGAQILQTQNLLRYDNNQDRQFGKVYANYAISNKDNLILTLKKGKESQLFKRNLTDNVGFNEFMTFEINRSSADLIWHRNTDKNEINFALNYKYNEGAGYDNDLAGVNYINDQETYGLKLYYTIKNDSKLINNFNIGAQQFEDIKKDGNYLVDISYSRLLLNAGWGFNKQLANNHSFGFAVSAAYTFKTSSNFNAPEENETIFYNHVIYPDYQFNTSNNYNIGLSADYTLPAYKGILASLRLSSNYIHHTGNYVDLNRTVFNAPGKDRYFNNISLNLYF
ncbi:MAG: hypothetical protein EOO87_02640 [Pedobacter sp.]|nr:MAG: hypothetical protein EOO87_02640 [Pedobacter sp.]